MVLERFTKQPAERLYYDVDFAPFLDARGLSAVSHTTVAEPGLTIDSSVLTGKVVRFYASGGESRRSYKVTVTVTATGGVVKEADVTISVRES